MIIKRVSVTPKGGDVLAVLQFFEDKAIGEGITLPEVEATSTELLGEFRKDMLNQLVSIGFLHVES